jgi:hypothetical protein
MFSECNQDKLSLLDLKYEFEKHFHKGVSKIAVHNRFNPSTVEFLKNVLKYQLPNHIKDNCSLDKDLEGFNRVCIKDSTKFTLPKPLIRSYPGFGGFNRSSGLMNIQYEYDIKSGDWISLELAKATRNDQQDSKETLDSICPNDLLIRDLGYSTINYMKGVSERCAYFINRLPTGVKIYKKTNNEYKEIKWGGVDKGFSENGPTQIEMDIFIGKKEKLPVRLVIVPVSNKVYEQRIRNAEKSMKSKGCCLSDEYKTRCKYNLFVANAPKDKISTTQIVEIYKLRWQIEIIFKAWKSVGNIHKVKKLKKERFESQLLAKLICILMKWKLLQFGNRIIQQQEPETGCSIVKFYKNIKKHTNELRNIILKKSYLNDWLNQFMCLLKNSIVEVKKGKTSLYLRFSKNSKCLS